jgi:hypothetical protein
MSYDLNVFVKGHLSFTLDGHTLEFVHQNISLFGVTGLPWDPLDSRVHFGKEVQVQLRIPGEPALQLKAPAFLLRELTLYAEHLGLRFALDPEQKSRLAAEIEKRGFVPTEYVRKYPRIPANWRVATFPLRVQVDPAPRDLGQELFPITLDVANLSPNGVLLTTENQMALSLAPNQRLNLVLEPRGWFPTSVKVEGLICRITDDLNPANGNLVRYVGIKFARVDDANKAAFLEMLKDILSQIKRQVHSARV